MLTKSNKKFYPMDFYVDFHPCCGVLLLTGFNVGGERPFGPPVKAYGTQEEAFNQFESTLIEKMWGERVSRDGNHRGSYVVQASFKGPKGKFKGEFPEFQKFLLKNGWKVDHEFVNSNTGNKVRLMSTRVPFSKFSAIRKEDGNENSSFNW